MGGAGQRSVPGLCAILIHAEVLEELEPQVWLRAHPAFEYPIPGQWPDPTDAALSDGDLPVQVVPLPTYASWLLAI